MYRPAWRKNQTGVTSTGLRRQARKKRWAPVIVPLAEIPMTDGPLELAEAGCMPERTLASERALAEIAVGSVMKRRLRDHGIRGPSPVSVEVPSGLWRRTQTVRYFLSSYKQSIQGSVRWRVIPGDRESPIRLDYCPDE
jgi:hypothetical protein